MSKLNDDDDDLLSYYSTTRCLLYPLYDEIVKFKAYLLQTDDVDRRDFIDRFYGKLVDNVKRSAELHVPLRYKNYYKFGWSEELGCLKAKAIKSDIIWKETDRPRSGPIADLRNSDKRNYKKMLYREWQAETVLH